MYILLYIYIYLYIIFSEGFRTCKE